MPTIEVTEKQFKEYQNGRPVTVQREIKDYLVVVDSNTIWFVRNGYIDGNKLQGESLEQIFGRDKRTKKSSGYLWADVGYQIIPITVGT